MLENLSSLEKKAIAKVLLDIVNADNKITNGEVRYFEQLQRNFDITDEQIEEAKYMSVTGCLSIINDLQFIDKKAVAIMMLEMIKADGEIDKEEVKIFSFVCAAANIPLPS
ncbi:MAG: hypothetical protein ACRC9X_00970 [Bacteroidales bacterium]